MLNKSEKTPPDAGTQAEDLSKLDGHEQISSSAQSEQPEKVEQSEQTNGPSEADIAHFIDVAQQLERELCSIVVGQEGVIRELLLALFAGGHVLLEGVPGLGKTLLVRTLADTLALKFARIQFTPDLMPADIVGTTIVTEQADDAMRSGSRRVFS